MAELSSDPYKNATSPLDNAEKAIGLMRSATGLQTDKFALAQKQLQQMQSMFGTLALKKDLTHDDIVNTGIKGVSLGLWSPKQLAVELGNVPAKPTGNSPEEMQKYQAQLKQYATGHLENVMSAAERFQQQYPTPQWRDNGRAQYPIAQSGLNPYPQSVGPPLENQLGPGEAYSPTEGPNIAGQPTKITRQQFFEGATGRGLPGYPSTGYGQQQPQGYPQQAPPNASPSAAPPTGHAPGGGLYMGNSPGFDEGMKLKAVTSGKMSDELAEAVNSSPQRKAALENLNGLVEHFNPGPGASDWNKIKAGINTNLPIPKGWELFDPKKIASQEEFNKQLNNLVQQQYKTLGGASDMRYKATMDSNPNGELSKRGIKQIIALARGNEDAISAHDDAWQRWQRSVNPQTGVVNGPQSKQEFNHEFNKVFDPRVFQFQYLKPDEQKQMYKDMNKSDRATFRKNFDAAEANGWVKPQE